MELLARQIKFPASSERTCESSIAPKWDRELDTLRLLPAPLLARLLPPIVPTLRPITRDLVEWADEDD